MMMSIVIGQSLNDIPPSDRIRTIKNFSRRFNIPAVSFNLSINVACLSCLVTYVVILLSIFRILCCYYRNSPMQTLLPIPYRKYTTRWTDIETRLFSLAR